MTDTRFAKLVLLANGLVPLGLLLWDVYRNRVGANPLEYATRTTGMLTLVFLTLTIGVSPVRQVFKWNGLGKFRRMLGLFAFFYALLHLLTYVAFDRYFNLRTVPARSEEHTSELQSQSNLVCRLLLEKKNYSCSIPTSA